MNEGVSECPLDARILTELLSYPGLWVWGMPKLARCGPCLMKLIIWRDGLVCVQQVDEPGGDLDGEETGKGLSEGMRG